MEFKQKNQIRRDDKNLEKGLFRAIKITSAIFLAMMAAAVLFDIIYN